MRTDPQALRDTRDTRENRENREIPKAVSRAGAFAYWRKLGSISFGGLAGDASGSFWRSHSHPQAIFLGAQFGCQCLAEIGGFE